MNYFSRIVGLSPEQLNIKFYATGFRTLEDAIIMKESFLEDLFLKKSKLDVNSAEYEDERLIVLNKPVLFVNGFNILNCEFDYDKQIIKLGSTNVNRMSVIMITCLTKDELNKDESRVNNLDDEISNQSKKIEEKITVDILDNKPYTNSSSNYLGEIELKFDNDLNEDYLLGMGINVVIG